METGFRAIEVCIIRTNIGARLHYLPYEASGFKGQLSLIVRREILLRVSRAQCVLVPLTVEETYEIMDNDTVYARKTIMYASQALKFPATPAIYVLDHASGSHVALKVNSRQPGVTKIEGQPTPVNVIMVQRVSIIVAEHPSS